MGLDSPLGPRPTAKISRCDSEASLEQGLANFSIKEQIGSISVFVSHVVSLS